MLPYDNAFAVTALAAAHAGRCAEPDGPVLRAGSTGRSRPSEKGCTTIPAHATCPCPDLREVRLPGYPWGMSDGACLEPLNETRDGTTDVESRDAWWGRMIPYRSTLTHWGHLSPTRGPHNGRDQGFG